MLIYTNLLGFFYILFPLSWILADPTILWSDYFSSWINKYLMNVNYDHLLVIEIMVFITGLVLLLASFVQLVRGMVKQQGIMQEGIYKYIRHPQNLAIIIMAFPLALYVPYFDDHGIRLADLITWVQFTLIVVIYSDLEDRRLKKKYPETFTSYYESTGFFLPKLLLLLLYIISVGIVRWISLNYPVTGWFFSP
ncbi:MAG: methyltransferase family protein [Candidatus Hodarchaeales archaeon]